MNKEQSERRLAENEVLFRGLNERTYSGFKEINRLAREDNQPEFVVGDDTEVGFLCECSDLNCKKHIRLTLRGYWSIHKAPNRFIVAPGHENLDIEQVVGKCPGYNVVQKNAEVLKG